ncbi:MAG TPA: VanZ family protein [Vicinamibacterales bacterium]|nr:VanZ family protein [Vicinamibacterales bacterium]
MRFILAAAVSAAVILSSPFMGRLQSLLQSNLSARGYLLLLGGVVAGAILLAIVAAFRRSRQHRAWRAAAMALAIAIGVLYTQLMSTGVATTDAVERVHFIEYGAIAVLFYRVWRRVGDPSTIILPLLCGIAVGTVDEWVQWFIPYRVGEAHDVLLNLTSLACGVLFGIALEPPPSFSWRPQPPSVRRIGIAGAVVVLLFAGFVDSVHLGHQIDVPGVGRFLSRYSLDELETLQKDRNVRWQAQPPIGISRLSREDQYLDEAIWHVRERNRLWAAADATGAWHENLILERFFVPVLDRPTYVSPSGTRWPPDHRADAAARATPSVSYVSAAEAQPLMTWPRAGFWAVVIALVTGILAATVRPALRTDRWR